MANQTIQIGTPYQSATFAFDGTENPLSEGEIWLANTNTALSSFRKSGGRAIGNATGASFDDSAALLDGYGVNVQLTGTVFKGTGLAATTHEMELLLRSTQSSTISLQYECLFSYTGGTQCFKWFNNGGSQGFQELTADSGLISLGRELITGDRIRARISGSTITMEVIEADNTVRTMGVFTDTTYSTGKPGIGAFTRASEGGDLTKFNFEAFSITEIA